MTVEERFERIEHVMAGLVEERRQDREEYRQLWRDSQRRMDALTEAIQQTNRTVERVAEELRDADLKLGQRIDALGDRIDNLVLGIGEFMRSAKPS